MIEDDIEQLRQDVTLALENDDIVTVSSMLDAVDTAQISNLLDSLPPQQRDLIWP